MSLKMARASKTEREEGAKRQSIRDNSVITWKSMEPYQSQGWHLAFWFLLWSLPISLTLQTKLTSHWVETFLRSRTLHRLKRLTMSISWSRITLLFSLTHAERRLRMRLNNRNQNLIHGSQPVFLFSSHLVSPSNLKKFILSRIKSITVIILPRMKMPTRFIRIRAGRCAGSAKRGDTGQSFTTININHWGMKPFTSPNS